LVDITIDGGSPTRVTRASGSDNVYAETFYQSPLLQAGSAHTVVLTNRGHPTDSSFQFDRVDLLAVDSNPTILSPPSLSNATPTTTQAVATTTTTTTNSPSDPTTSPPGSSPSGSTSANSGISSSGSTSSGSGGQYPLLLLFIIALAQTLNTQTVLITTRSGQIVTLTQQITNAGQSTLVTSTSTIIIDATNGHRAPLSAGAFAGIAIGALVILALLIAGCFVLKKRRRGRSRGHQMLENNEVEMRQAAPTGRCVYLGLSSFLKMLTSSHLLLALAVPTPYPTEPQLLLIPPSKENRSPHGIDGPSNPTNESTSRSSEASNRTQPATRTETQFQLPNPPTTTATVQPHTTSNSNRDTQAVGNTSGPSLPPGLITHAHEEDHESQRESTFTFDAPPPAYQPQRGSAGGIRLSSILRS